MVEARSLSLVVGFLFALVTFQAEAFREDRDVYKWSPRYLFKGPMDSLHNGLYQGIPQRTARYSGGLSGMRNLEGSLGSRIPGYRAGGYYGIYKREYSNPSTQSCMNPGEVCMFRSGLVGAVIKMNCCEGSTCSMFGTRFVCIKEESMNEYDDEDQPDEYEGAEEDSE